MLESMLSEQERKDIESLDGKNNFMQLEFYAAADVANLEKKNSKEYYSIAPALNIVQPVTEIVVYGDVELYSMEYVTPGDDPLMQNDEWNERSPAGSRYYVNETEFTDTVVKKIQEDAGLISPAEMKRPAGDVMSKSAVLHRSGRARSDDVSGRAGVVHRKEKDENEKTLKEQLGEAIILVHRSATQPTRMTAKRLKRSDLLRHDAHPQVVSLDDAAHFGLRLKPSYAKYITFANTTVFQLSDLIIELLEMGRYYAKFDEGKPVDSPPSIPQELQLDDYMRETLESVMRK